MAEESSTRDIKAFVVAIGIIAIVGLIMSILALGRALAGDDGTALPPATSTTSAATTTTVSGAQPEAIVTLTEFAINPTQIEVAAGGTLVITNTGLIEHDFHVVGTDLVAPLIAPGGVYRMPLGDLAAGTYQVLCGVSGHEPAGMHATLVVGDGGDGHEGHGSAITWEEMEENMRASIAAFPAATEGVGAQPFEPTILPDGTKEFVLVVEEIDWEVEPGRIVDGIAYNGQIPGPTIRVDVGDRVRIVVENRLNEITSWHPHGVRRHPFGADGVGFITQDPIRPGETWSVEFVAEELSVGMYHGHDMGIHQVPNGLAGAFIVGEIPIPDGWNVVGEEVMFLNDAGNIGFSLNGKSFPATAPYVLKQGEALMVHYMNEGLTAHPMHLHNNRQLVIAKDGFPLESPYYVDTLDVAPGERYTVLALAELPGVWVWHCHIFPHVERPDGTMFGMLTAFIVEE